jgi:hypothetical protein
MPEVEKGLVTNGLSQETATAVVMAVLEGRVRAGQPPEMSDAAVLAHRIAAVVAIVVCLGLAYADGGKKSVGRTALWLVLPVPWIWFSGAILRQYIAELTEPRWRFRSYSWVVLLSGGGARVEEGDQIVLKALIPWIPWVWIGSFVVTQIVQLSV